MAIEQPFALWGRGPRRSLNAPIDLVFKQPLKIPLPIPHINPLLKLKSHLFKMGDFAVPKLLMQGYTGVIGKGYSTDDHMIIAGNEAVEYGCVQQTSDAFGPLIGIQIDRSFRGMAIAASQIPVPGISIPANSSVHFIDQPKQ